jgi:transcriptional regulator with XRE-family HTH domain
MHKERVVMKKVIFPYTPKEAEEAGIKLYTEINRDAEFPKRMREARNKISERNGKTYTQEEAAKAIGVTRSTIGLYETGDNVPDIKTTVRIAEAYNVTVNYLLGLDERPTYEEDFIVKQTGLSPEAVNILIRLKNIKSDPAERYITYYKRFLSEIIPEFSNVIAESYLILSNIRKQKSNESGYPNDEEFGEFSANSDSYILSIDQAKEFSINLICKEIENVLRKGGENNET